jgi:predicted ester cyclase
LSEAAKHLVLSFFSELNETQSGQAFVNFGAENYVGHFPGMPELNREAMGQVGSGFYLAFPGLRHEVQDIVSEGDRVAVRLLISGKHTGTLMLPSGHVPPTGKDLAIEAQNVFHVANGKVVEHWISMDMMTMLQQLGLLQAF